MDGQTYMSNKIVANFLKEKEDKETDVNQEKE